MVSDLPAFSGTAALCEMVMAGFFIFIIMGATQKSAPMGFACVAIGLAPFQGDWPCTSRVPSG
ncbi:hypothetical protein CIW53_16370 [Rhodanobacter sp. T12-5]|nr:hypothetical protein CIW53_16370 [Rhodanobacter sp. T12-5]